MITCNKVVIVLWATDGLFLKSQSSARLSHSLQSGSDVVLGIADSPFWCRHICGLKFSLVLSRVSSYILISRKPEQTFCNPNPDPVNFNPDLKARAYSLPLYFDVWMFGTK